MQEVARRSAEGEAAVSTTLMCSYAAEEVGADGYPSAWHRCPRCAGSGYVCDSCGKPPNTDECCRLACSGCPDCCRPPLVVPGAGSIKALVRALAGERCVRCHHPYAKGAGEWSPCDGRCAHDDGAVRYSNQDQPGCFYVSGDYDGFVAWRVKEARWRILTVHHLDGDKANCRWYNLAALCQRCHLTIQGKVRMERVWPWEHSDWFQPYVAGFYAWSYLGEDLTRAEVEVRLDELLDLERVVGA